MKKLLMGIGMTFGALAIFYGGVSSLVNKGFSLTSAITTFFLVVIGGSLLVWFLKEDSNS